MHSVYIDINVRGCDDFRPYIIDSCTNLSLQEGVCTKNWVNTGCKNPPCFVTERSLKRNNNGR
ncbi:MAG: hypothetical protein RL213_1241 [Bacteroidota bacterium]